MRTLPVPSAALLGLVAVVAAGCQGRASNPHSGGDGGQGTFSSLGTHGGSASSEGSGGSNVGGGGSAGGSVSTGGSAGAGGAARTGGNTSGCQRKLGGEHPSVLRLFE